MNAYMYTRYVTYHALMSKIITRVFKLIFHLSGLACLCGQRLTSQSAATTLSAAAYMLIFRWAGD